MILYGCPNPHSLEYIFNKIRRLLDSGKFMSLNFFDRESNRLADALAHYGHSLPLDVSIFDDCPVFCRGIALDDLYSSFFTSMEFGFFRGLPEDLFILDIIGQLAFLVDIVLQFFVAYRDSQTYRMVYKITPIALRYIKSSFVFDLLGCMPWDLIYKACGRREEVRYLLWIRLYRVRKVRDFFQKLEKDIRINYMFARIVRLLAVELYCTHIAACIFYYLATTLPPSQEGYTWIGSLKMGDFSYSDFRNIDLWKRYTTSLYFSILTMSTVGYGDIHAVNMREMIFVMIYVSFDMVIGAYLIGNITALIVRGSKTEKFREKMKDLMTFMNRNRLERDIREQIKGHVCLQYESSYAEAAVVQELPISIRAKISQTLYLPYIEKVSLFKGCSSEFISQIVIRLHEEFFLPGEVIMEYGSVVDQLYFVCHGLLEEVGTGEDGSEKTVSLLQPYSVFGQVSVLCNIPQPYTVRGKESFNDKQLGSDISLHIGKQEAELALKVNSAAFQGDLYHLKASKGHEDIAQFLIQEGVDVNIKDNFGNTPLLEAVKNGHDQVASLLFKEGALMGIDNAATFLCTIVARGDSDYVKRLLSNGMDPNLKDYDHRSPLHIAAAEGLYFMAKLLLEAGASVFTKDRWGNTPIDEARMCGNKNMMKLLEEAKSAQLLEFPNPSTEFQDKVHQKKCTVFPFHPWDPKEEGRCGNGIVLWVPHRIEELVQRAAEKLDFSTDSCILSEDAGLITDVDMIKDGQKLHLVLKTQ
ncbi:potassium channel SKOR [Senna tora]|uniref:Potassium channel n=1 Tax=Senna tora TaxID=362788 RepID=A0A834TYJ5_9FABA|nr:potassium channel SKOR [Senna tora]